MRFAGRLRLWKFQRFARGVNFARDALGKLAGVGGIGLRASEFVRQFLDAVQSRGKGGIVNRIGRHSRLPSADFCGEMVELGLHRGDALKLHIEHALHRRARLFQHRKPSR
jgi:hypothetical protein